MRRKAANPTRSGSRSHRRRTNRSSPTCPPRAQSRQECPKAWTRPSCEAHDPARRETVAGRPGIEVVGRVRGQAGDEAGIYACPTRRTARPVRRSGQGRIQPIEKSNDDGRRFSEVAKVPMQGCADVLNPRGGFRENAGSRPGHREVLAREGNLAAPIVDREVDSVHAFGGIDMAHAVSGHGRLVSELPGMTVRALSSQCRSKEIDGLTRKRARW